jgi:hypothetical protein
MGFQVNLLAPSVDLVSPRGDLLGLLHRLPHRSLHQLPLCFDYCSHGQAAYSRGFLAVSNESVIVPMARSSLVQKPLPLLNALMLFSGRIHLHLCLCPCPRHQASLFSMPDPLRTAAIRWLLCGTSPSLGKQFGGAYLNSDDDNPSTLWSRDAVFTAPLPLLETDALCGPPSTCTRSSRLCGIADELVVVERFDVSAGLWTFV